MGEPPKPPAPELTEEKIAEVIAVLRLMEPGKIHKGLFPDMARLVNTQIIELVPVRRSAEGRIEVLLTRRPHGDPIWPDKLHTPGTIVSASDRPFTYDDAFNRLFEGELQGVETGEPVLAHPLPIPHDSERGRENALVYWVEVKGEATAGDFYDVEALPSDLVQSQLDFIPVAIESYRAANQAQS